MRADTRREWMSGSIRERFADAARAATLTTLAALMMIGGLAPVAAQDPDDEAAVLAVIDRLFDSMRANDADGIRSVFVEGAHLISTEGQDGSPATSYIPTERFATMIGGAQASIDEPYWDPIIQIHDHLATVWVKYAVYVNEDFSHCGVDAFILTRQPDGWKIAALADTRERDNCELPPGREPPTD